MGDNDYAARLKANLEEEQEQAAGAPPKIVPGTTFGPAKPLNLLQGPWSPKPNNTNPFVLENFVARQKMLNFLNEQLTGEEIIDRGNGMVERRKKPNFQEPAPWYRKILEDDLLRLMKGGKPLSITEEKRFWQDIEAAQKRDAEEKAAAARREELSGIPLPVARLGQAPNIEAYRNPDEYREFVARVAAETDELRSTANRIAEMISSEDPETQATGKSMMISLLTERGITDDIVQAYGGDWIKAMFAEPLGDFKQPEFAKKFLEKVDKTWNYMNLSAAAGQLDMNLGLEGFIASVNPTPENIERMRKLRDSPIQLPEDVGVATKYLGGVLRTSVPMLDITLMALPAMALSGGTAAPGLLGWLTSNAAMGATGIGTAILEGGQTFAELDQTHPEIPIGARQAIALSTGALSGYVEVCGLGIEANFAKVLKGLGSGSIRRFSADGIKGLLKAIPGFSFEGAKMLFNEAIVEEGLQEADKWVALGIYEAAQNLKTILEATPEERERIGDWLTLRKTVPPDVLEAVTGMSRAEANAQFGLWENNWNQLMPTMLETWKQSASQMILLGLSGTVTNKLTELTLGAGDTKARSMKLTDEIAKGINVPVDGFKQFSEDLAEANSMAAAANAAGRIMYENERSGDRQALNQFLGLPADAPLPAFSDIKMLRDEWNTRVALGETQGEANIEQAIARGLEPAFEGEVAEFGPGAKAPRTLRMWIPEQAMNAEQQAKLSIAQTMLAAGESPDAIRMATGMVKSPDVRRPWYTEIGTEKGKISASSAEDVLDKYIKKESGLTTKEYEALLGKPKERKVGRRGGALSSMFASTGRLMSALDQKIRESLANRGITQPSIEQITQADIDYGISYITNDAKSKGVSQDAVDKYEKILKATAEAHYVGIPIEEVYRDSDLYKALPWLKETRVKIRILPAGTMAAHSTTTMGVGPNAGKPTSVISIQSRLSTRGGQSAIKKESYKESVLHELQHAVQRHYDMATGSNLNDALELYAKDPKPWKDLLLSKWGPAKRRVNLAKNEIYKADQAGIDPESESYRKLEYELEEAEAIETFYAEELHQLDQGNAYPIYARYLGEIVARDAQIRGRMTPEQRAMVPPFESGRLETIEHPFRNKPILLRDILPGEEVVRYNQTRRMRQPVQGIDENLRMAERAEGDFRQAVEFMATAAGGEMEIAPRKTEADVRRKAHELYNGDHSQVTDYLRGRIVLDESLDLGSFARNWMGKQAGPGTVVWARVYAESDGYRRNEMLVRLPNGHTAEIEVTTRNMVEAKKVFGDSSLELMTRIVTLAQDPRVTAEDREVMRGQVAALRDLSRKFYDGAALVSAEEINSLYGAPEIGEPLSRILAATEGSIRRVHPFFEPSGSLKTFADSLETAKTAPAYSMKSKPTSWLPPVDSVAENRSIDEMIDNTVKVFGEGKSKKETSLMRDILNWYKGRLRPELFKRYLGAAVRGLPVNGSVLYDMSRPSIDMVKGMGLITDEDVKVFDWVQTLSQLDSQLFHTSTGKFWRMAVLDDAAAVLGLRKRPAGARPADIEARGVWEDDVMNEIQRNLSRTDIQEIMAKADAKYPGGSGVSPRGERFQNYINVKLSLDQNPSFVKVLRDCEASLGITLIDENNYPVGTQGMATLWETKTPGGPNKPTYPSWTTSFSQIAIDNLGQDQFTDIQNRMLEGMKRGYEEYRAEKAKAEPDAKKLAKLEKVYGLTLSQLSTKARRLGGAPVVRPAEKTVASSNLNTVCPQYEIGYNGCYFDCYVTQMSEGSGAVPSGRRVMYLGDFLQLTDEEIRNLNDTTGGLRMSGWGDLDYDTHAGNVRWALRDAGIRGLKLKFITKQEGPIRILSEALKDPDPDVRAGARLAAVQISTDTVWIPIETDQRNPHVHGMLESAKRAIADGNEDLFNESISQLKGYYDKTGRTYKMVPYSEDYNPSLPPGRVVKPGEERGTQEIAPPDDYRDVWKKLGGVLVRGWGVKSERLKEWAGKYPNLGSIDESGRQGGKVGVRAVLMTPKQIADTALKLPQVLQTWMHGKPGWTMYDDASGTWIGPDDTLNFGARHRIYKGEDGKYHLEGRKSNTDKVTSKDAYQSLEEYIVSNYSEEEQTRIWETLVSIGDTDSSALCCAWNAEANACAACTAYCHQGEWMDSQDLWNLAEEAREAVLFDEYKGAAEMLKSGQWVLYAANAADFSTFVHELVHPLTFALSDEDQGTLKEWAGLERTAEWSEEGLEKVARGFEVYCAEGVAPSTGLKSIFKRMAEFLKDLVEKIGIDLTPEVRRVFDHIWTGEVQENSIVSVPEKYWKNVGFYVDLPGPGATAAEITKALEKIDRASESARAERQRYIDEAKTVRARVMRSTNQRKLKVYVDEYEALLGSIRKEQEVAKQAARAAAADMRKLRDQYAEATRAALETNAKKGRLAKEAAVDRVKNEYQKRIDRQKQMLIETKAAAAEEIAAMKARKRAEWLGKAITRDVPSSVDWYYAEAIHMITDGINPKFLGARSKEKIDAARAWVDANRARGIPFDEKLLDIVNTKNLNDFTLGELEELYKERKKIELQGRLVKKWRDAEKLRVRTEAKDEIVNRIRAKAPEKDKGGAILQPRKVRKLRTLRATTLNMQRIADLLDGGRAEFDGPAFRYIYRRINEAENAKAVEVEKRLKNVHGAMKDLKIKPKDLLKKLKGAPFKPEKGRGELTIQKAMYIYIGERNHETHQALVYDNRIPESGIEWVKKNLPERYKKLAEKIADDFNSRRSALGDTFIRLFNKPMRFVDWYVPMKRSGRLVTSQKYEKELLDEMNGRTALVNAYPPKGFTKSRVHRGKKPLHPISLDLYNLWSEAVVKQENFIHYSEPSGDLHWLNRQDDFYAAVKDRLGDEYFVEIQKYANRVGDPNFYKVFDAVDSVTRILRTNTTRAISMFNFTMALKAPVSIFNAMQESNPVDMIVSLVRPVKAIRFSRSDPQIRNASIDRFMEEIRSSRPELFNLIQAKLGKKGYWLLTSLDRWARGVVYTSTFNTKMRERQSDGSKRSEDQARAMAAETVLRTQGAALPKDIPGLFASESEWVAWLTAFQNQSTQVWNTLSYDIPRKLLGRKKRSFFYGVMGASTAAYLMFWLTNGHGPKDDKDKAEMVIGQTIGTAPILGNTLSALMDGFQPGTMWDGLMRDLYRATTAKDKKSKQESALKAVSKMVAVPNMYWRIRKYTQTHDFRDIMGWDKE